MLAFHGSRDKIDFQLVGYNSRLDELQAAFLRLFLEQLEGWTRGRREAAARYAELGLGDLVELARRRAGPRLPPLRLPLARAGLDQGGARRGGDRVRDVLHDAAASPTGTPLPRLGARVAARDRARRRRELLRAALARHRAGDPGARRRRRSFRRGRPRVMPDHAASALAGRRRRGADRRRVVPGVPAPLRLRGAALLRDDAPRDDRLRRRDQARGVRRVRLLPALVALRVHARHVARSARRRRRVGARDRGRLLLLSRRAAEAAARGRAGRSAAAARLRRGLAPARADGDRAPEGRARRARPEGADRRRRRRGQADRPGAPALEGRVLDAGRAHRRRPAQARDAPARRACARHHGRSAAHPQRQPPRRGADRGPLRAG